MDSVWMKNVSVLFTYSSRRNIFLQGCPQEMWRSHARRPAATLPTRFSIKQANNTIPTPINKWLFLNKVLYTEPLTEATHHTLMGPVPAKVIPLLSPSFYLSLLCTERGNKVNRGSWNRRRWVAFRSSSCHHLAQHWLRYSTISFMIYEAINMLFLSPSPSSRSHTNTQTLTRKLLEFTSQLFSLLETGCSQQFEHSERWLARCLGVCQRGAIVSSFLIRCTWQKRHQIRYTTENMRRDHT